MKRSLSNSILIFYNYSSCPGTGQVYTFFFDKKVYKKSRTFNDFLTHFALLKLRKSEGQRWPAERSAQRFLLDQPIEKGSVNLIITDLVGKQYESVFEVTKNDSQTLELDVKGGSLKNGIYFIQVLNNNKPIGSTKLMKR